MIRAALAVALAGGLLSCTNTQLRTLCIDDLDCPANTKCDKATGSCWCANDAACEVGEFCNGRTCQKRVGCDTSLDCPEGTFCDPRTGNCLDRDVCTRDVHCPLGEVCDDLRFQCVPGCRETGDCMLGQVCRCAEGETCTIGECIGNSCDDDTFCRYGERCIEAADGKKTCQKDERGPFCQGCQLNPGTLSRCPGDEPNFCLLDRKVDYRRTYCGVDCSQGQPCPFGYECRNILVLTRSLCQKDEDCGANGATCETDADCPGARCDATAKRCAGKCSFNEDSKSGFCTCSADSECPKDECDTTTRKCAISRRPCSPEGGECSRPPIYCVNLGTRAACLIGKNCVPGEGLKCEDVRGGDPTP